MEHAKQEPPSAEPMIPGELSDTDLADSFRTQSFHLMQEHPIAAAHLVLAAASIAPTCHAEQDVAEQFSYVIVDFAQQLGVLPACRQPESAGIQERRQWALMTATTCAIVIASAKDLALAQHGGMNAKAEWSFATAMTRLAREERARR